MRRTAAADMRRLAFLTLDDPTGFTIDDALAADGAFWTMEVELIEPGLYLRMHPDAPRRFAEAFAARMG